MSIKQLTDKKRLILGLGQTGLSVARFLTKAGQFFNVMDTREEVPGIEELNQFAADSYLEWQPELFVNYDELVVSPGISINRPDIQKAAEQGVEIVGDIELFAQVNTAKVVAITGSNGKSTVTELVANAISAAGFTAVAAGNFGFPALDTLEQKCDFVVLELSSFQLETTDSLGSEVATILNISEDHLDRYDTYQDYINAKKRIYLNAKKRLFNVDDENTFANSEAVENVSFGLKSTKIRPDYCLDLDKKVLSKSGLEILPIEELQLQGTHNALNALAALALIEQSGIEINDKVLTAVKKYQGLEHRCELVFKTENVSYINDSKATNVGATIAALNSFAPLFKNIILIAGGDAKGVDLSSLENILKNVVHSIVVFGKDANKIAELSREKSHVVDNMAQALAKAKQIIESKTLKQVLVLLSPACASLDQYKNYQERGNEFSKLARALAC